MKYIINVQLRSDLPNGDVFNYRYEITENEAEKLDDVGGVFEDYFAQFMKEYTKAKANLNKEQDFGQ